MPPSSQTGRPTLTKQSSSSFKTRPINSFFKPFTIPKNRIPTNDVVEEEIVGASPQRPLSSDLTSSLSSSVNGPDSGRKSRSGSGVSTPTRRRGSPVKRQEAQSHAQGLDGTDDGELLRETPSSSQRRVMSAVEIPTPTIPQSEPQRAETNTTNANMTSHNTTTNPSFNSTSSLTSLPISSQSSSRRIVKDGVPVVTNSDSGSASDSEEELKDIFFQPRKRMRMTPPPGASKHTAISVPSTVKPAPPTTAARQSNRLSVKSSSLNSRRVSPSPPPANASALMKLVREKEKREREDAKILEAENAFESEQKLREEKLARERDLGGGLRELVEGDSDEGERMMLAVQRTEALGEEEGFFYFCAGGGNGDGIREDGVGSEEVRDGDVHAYAPWAEKKFARLNEMVLNDGAREGAALSGMLAEIAGKVGLPPELMDWMFGRLVREEREELCEAYVEVFRRWLLKREAPARCEYGLLSGVFHVVDSRGTDGKWARLRSDAQQAPLPQRLRHVLRVAQYACSHRSNDGSGDGLTKPFLEVALASADTRVSKDLELCGQFTKTLAAIIDNNTLSALRSLAFAFLNGAPALLPLRCRIVASLPAQTEDCHTLRRLLALLLVTGRGAEALLGKSHAFGPRSSDWSTILLSHLRSAPEWQISEATDYAQLNALIPVLDIAVEAGFSPPSESTTAPATKPTSKHAPHLVPSKTPKPGAKDAAFNAQVDELTDHLRLMASRVRDAGTSHLRRTEAKSALERVIVRLEHCVRTKPRPRRGVFGGGEEQTRLLGRFLAMGREESESEAGTGAADRHGESGGGKGEGEGRKLKPKRKRDADDAVVQVKGKPKWKTYQRKGDPKDNVEVVTEEKWRSSDQDGSETDLVGGNATSGTREGAEDADTGEDE